MYRGGEPNKDLNLEEPQDDLLYLNEMSKILSGPWTDNESTFIAEESASSTVDPAVFSHIDINN